MEDTNALLLNRIFTRNTLSDIISYGRSDTFDAVKKRYIEDPQGKDNLSIISEIYKLLEKKYQNEYFYKNTILNKLLLGVHKPNTTTALTEIPVGKSKVDFVLINGKAVAYEIKTTLDNFDRLKGQLNDYYKAFSRVAVVTSEDHYEEAQSLLENTPTGLYVLTKRIQLSERKKPEEYCNSLDLKTMFKTLRKCEYQDIIEKCYGELPNVTDFEYYRRCQELFERLDTKIAYGLFLEELKKRRPEDLPQYKQVPYELKFLTYFLNLREQEYNNLNNFLFK